MSISRTINSLILSVFLSMVMHGVSYADESKNITFEEAGALARQVKVPDFAKYLTKESMNTTLPPSSFGDTQSLSDLRGEKGLGDIKTPGLNKAIACDTKTDPECLAIQMLRYGSANNPSFDETTKEAIRTEYDQVMGNKDVLLGDLTQLGSHERVCETIETVIPGQKATEVCDITTATGSTQGQCQEGWEESKSLLVFYQCTMNALDVTNACTVTTTALTHSEDIYQCTDRKPTYETRTCDVPANVVVTKTYPYTCPITMAEEKKTSCVRTLNVVVTPLCSTNPSETIRLNPFRENYGWKPSSSYLRLEATLTCAETLSAITLTFKSAGSVVATMSSFPASTTITIKDFAMTIDVKRVTIDAQPYLEVLVTNVDTGQGTTTIATNLLMQTTKQQEHDVWSESCQEVAS